MRRRCIAGASLRGCPHCATTPAWCVAAGRRVIIATHHRRSSPSGHPRGGPQCIPMVRIASRWSAMHPDAPWCAAMPPCGHHSESMGATTRVAPTSWPAMHHNGYRGHHYRLVGTHQGSPLRLDLFHPPCLLLALQEGDHGKRLGDVLQANQPQVCLAIVYRHDAHALFGHNLAHLV